MAAKKEHSKPSPQEPDTFKKLDEAFSEADVEDRLWVFWNRYKKPISSAITLALVLIVGYHGYGWLQAKKLAELSAAYNEATDSLSLKQFAESNDGTQLAGAAYLELADEAFEAFEYKKAAELYAKATQDLDIPLLAVRSSLGQAMALQLDGDLEGSRQAFEGVAANPAAPKSFQAEALYHLLVQCWEAGDTAGAQARYEEIQAVGESLWSGKAQRLFETAPELVFAQQEG